MIHFQSLLLAACMAVFAAAAPAQDSGPAQLVMAQKAANGLIERVYHTTGRVQPGRLVTAASQYGGRIVELMVSVGTPVEKDQPLARLRPKEAEMRDSSITSGDRGHIVVANISGIIVEQIQEFGNVVAPGGLIFRIASDAGNRVKIDLPINMARYISQDTRVRYSALDGASITATPISNTPFDISGSGFFTLTIMADKSLTVAGTVLDVEVVLKADPNALLVPRAALVRRDGKFAVFVIKVGVARRRNVRVGIETRDLAEILSGLEPGERVVTRGNYNLLSGTRVTVFAGG